jgi:hypothetical protein
VSVELISNTLFVKQFISVLIPDLQTEIVKGIGESIDAELKYVPIENVNAFPFASFSLRHEQSAVAQLEIAVGKIHRGILTSPDFLNVVGELRQLVSSHLRIRDCT